MENMDKKQAGKLLKEQVPDTVDGVQEEGVQEEEGLEGGDTTLPPEQEEENEGGRKKPRRTFEHQFRDFRVILAVSSTDPRLIEAAQLYGYPPERIAGGSALFEQLGAAWEVQKTRGSELRVVHKQFVSKMKAADDTTLYFREMARLVFKDDAAMVELLELYQRKKRTYSERVAVNKRFFTNLFATTGAVEAMAAFNVTLEQLQAAEAVVDEAIAADTAKQAANAEAQVATDEKIKQFKIIRAWIALYIKVMRVALKDNPQLLEKLGIIVPTSQ
ncbi:MAG: hypothetical protein GY757_45385 [bacterium]|nr:hypothetical protein [bacterium]